MGYFRRRQASSTPVLPRCVENASLLPLNWEALAQWMDDEVSTDLAFRDIDCVWVLAHGVHAALEDHPVDASMYNGLTHALAIPLVVDQFHQGNFYAAFTILVTILERALYDQYAALHKGQKSNMILRDLLHSPELERHLPRGYMQVLRVLFLPSGLNIRNLVWHGFLAPFELPACLNMLLLALLADPCLQTEASRRVSEKLAQQLPPMDLTWAQTTRAAFTAHAMDASSILRNVNPAYALVMRSRRGLIQQAMAAYATGRSMWSLFLAIPVLEHLVRCEFVLQNAPSVPSAMQTAQLKEYYSTLDGFGQRHQHQVLLARELFAANATNETQQNRLYGTLPDGALAVCLDLFMAAAGPNIRAKLCHGELSLDLLHAKPHGADASMDGSSVEACAGLVLAVLVEILNPGTSRRVGIPLASYDCMFHPYNLLLRSLKKLDAALTAWIELQPTFAHTASPSPTAADHAIWVWTALAPAATTAPNATIQFTDKLTRMIPRQTSTSWDGSTTQFESIPDGIATLLALLEKLSGTLCTNHCPDSRFFNDRSSNSDSPKKATALPRLNLLSFQAVPAAACMLAVVDACQILLEKAMARLMALRDLVVQGTARTSHRRTLVNLVLMAPCLTHMIRLSGALIEHQVGMAHRASTATRAFDGVAEKLLHFVVALDDDKKSVDKQVYMALQFWNSKAIRVPICSPRS